MFPIEYLFRSRPRSFLLFREIWIQAIQIKETKCRLGSRIVGVVPMKLDNADGGKASYQLYPLLRKHLQHLEVEILNGYKTT